MAVPLGMYVGLRRYMPARSWPAPNALVGSAKDATTAALSDNISAAPPRNLDRTHGRPGLARGGRLRVLGRDGAVHDGLERAVGPYRNHRVSGVRLAYGRTLPA